MFQKSHLRYLVYFDYHYCIFQEIGSNAYLLSNSLQAWLIFKIDIMSISFSFIVIQHFVVNEKHNMYLKPI